MTHPNDLLQRAIDGELAPAEQALLNAHLATCARCRAVIAAQRQVEGLLRSGPRPQLPPDFTRLIQARVVALPPPPRLAPWYIPVALIMSGMGVLGILLAWQEFSALVTDVASASDGLTLWVITSAGGITDPDTGSFATAAAQSHLGLVLCLCLLAAACVLVLRQQTELF